MCGTWEACGTRDARGTRDAGRGALWRRWRLSEGALAGYCAAAAATTVAVGAGGTRHPVVALTVLAMAMLAVALRMTLPAALASGVIGWLFYDGFVIGRHAHLVMGGASGPLAGWSLLVVVAAALCGSAVGPRPVGPRLLGPRPVRPRLLGPRPLGPGEHHR
jgi:hypothetical protein